MMRLAGKIAVVVDVESLAMLAERLLFAPALVCP
jgi:hypothetical protein